LPETDARAGRSLRTLTNRTAAAIGCIALALVTAAAAAQALPDTIARTSPPSLSASEPLQCWLRTSTRAVRVGEVFSVVITCALLNGDSTIVVADETRLDSSAIQLPPFDVIRATHAAGLEAGHHRFFQYEYDVRLINDSLFGADVTLPPVKIPYRVRTRLDNGGLSEGLERTYALTPPAIRVLSLAPGDATDIRDAPAATFASIESRAFRASILTNSGGVLMALGALFAIVGLAQAAAGGRTRVTSGPRPVSNRRILRRVGREIDAVSRERDGSGWTPELAARALTALRIAASYALAQTPSQRVVEPDAEPEPGALLIVHRVTGSTVLVSGSTTPRQLAETLTRTRVARRAKQRLGEDNMRRLTELQEALTSLTQACYGRGTDSQVEPRAADAALAFGELLVRSLQRDNRWVARSRRAVASRTRGAARRLWIR
jgi:hypothetical protein